MPLSRTHIAEFTKRAKLAGLDDTQIQQEIERKAQELYANSSVADASYGGMQPPGGMPAPQATGAKATPAVGQEEQGGFIGNFIKGLVEPAVSYGKFVGEAGYQAGRFAFDPVFRKAVLGEKLSPKEQEELAKKKETLFYQGEEDKVDDTGSILATGAKATAGAASYAVPFGRGAGIASKVLLPGAAAGALSEASRDEATIDSVAESGVTGAVTAGALHGIGGMVSWARGKGGELVRQSQALEEGTRKIRQPASVYGARTEKAVNSTLDKWGFKGTAQQQYERLEPAMQEIEGKIQQVIQENPDLGANADDITKAFMDELSSSLRTKDITKKQAQEEIKSYLTDVMKAAGKVGAETGQPLLKENSKDISLAGLREMKKIINQDMGGIYKKLEKGTPLNPTEKVTMAAWESLDNAVKTASPEIKELLVDESNLYRAAQSLSSARANPPTFRVWGTSVPASVTQKLRDFGSGLLKKLGLSAEKLPEGSQLQRSTLEKLAALSPAALKEQGLSDEEIQQVTALQQELPAGGAPGGVADQVNQPPMANEPQALNPFGNFTRRQVLALALSNGASAKDLDEVGQIYDMLASDSETVNAETMKVADSLRSEYFARTKENQFIDVANAYNKVVNTSDTAAGDVSLIFAFMKILDPGSVVREGEFATAENTSGIPDMVRQQYNKVLKGERLNQHQRVAFRNEAGRVFQVYQQRQAPIDAYYQGLAKRYGVDPSLLGVGLYQ